MKVSYNWLKNYINTKQSPEQLSAILTDVGLEVEEVEKVEIVRGSLSGVIIGEVLTCLPHENSDRLKVTTVNIGEAETLQIVCGASNVAVGQKVAVATVGTTLYPKHGEPFKIKKSKIRGLVSFGMICAEDELGLGTSHDGIMILPADAKVGRNLNEYLELEDDYILTIGLTPNRSDALGHIGVAREIFAYNRLHKVEKSNLKLPDINSYNVIEQGDKVKIKVNTPEICPRYMGCVISNIKVQPSPDWLQRYLKAIGLSPINNVVDITNFVMHELGTPIHAFDVRKIGESIIVDFAKEGEKFTALDGVERKMSQHDLMITNGKKSLAIAGVLGGLESGVKDDTTTIFIEVAYFNPITVRKTAKRHGLNTDASFRFERGIDYNLLKFAMKRAATLISQIAGGTISYEPIPFYPKKIEDTKVVFRYSRCNQLIGNDIEVDTINEILNVLDIEILHNNGDNLKLKIPSYRVDVTREIDVVEEVLRIYGFNKITTPNEWKVSLSNHDLRVCDQKVNAISDLLTGKGFYEMMNNSLTASKWIDENGGTVISNDSSVKMLNPLSIDLDIMRQTLVFQGLSAVVHNRNRQNPDLKLFEFGTVYQKTDGIYSENKRLAVFLSGNKEPEQWNSNPKAVSFFTLKGIVKAVFERLGLSKTMSEKSLDNSLFEDGVQLFVSDVKVGETGWTSDKTNRSLGLKQRVYIADLDWEALVQLSKNNEEKYMPLPKTFSVRRDYSLLLDNNITFKEIENIAYNVNRKLLKNVNLFDVYEGDKLPENKKSYAVSFHFQDNEKTLRDEQIDKIMEDIRISLEKELKSELRQ